MQFYSQGRRLEPLNLYIIIFHFLYKFILTFTQFSTTLQINILYYITTVHICHSICYAGFVNNVKTYPALLSPGGIETSWVKTVN